MSTKIGTNEDIQANRDYFAAKLRAETQKNDVIKKVKREAGAPTDLFLLDVRSRNAFAKAHIQGAYSAPLEELRGAFDEREADALRRAARDLRASWG